VNGEKYLEIISQPMDKLMKEQIKKELERLQEDADYSQKGHFAAASIFGYVHFALGIIASILSFIAVSIILIDPTKLKAVAFLSLFAGILTVISTFVNPDKRKKEHLKAGNLYLSLRNDARIFNNTKLDQLEDAKASEHLDKLNKERNQLNCDMPQIPGWAFRKARKNIEDGQLEYKTDKN